MHNELRYQAKTHVISEKLSKKKNSYLLPQIFFLLKNETNNKKKQQQQQRHAYGKGNDIYSQHVR
jgi:hypothetical protein